MPPTKAPEDAPPAPKPRGLRGRRKGLRMTIDHPQLGRIDVRHMRAVELAAATIGADTAPVWIQLAKVGQFAGHPSGPFELTAQTFAEIVRNFRATENRRVPIDFEHASEADPTSGSIPTLGAPAVGWILDLDNRGEAGLWALVEWGATAREYIRSGAYRYISPAMRFGSRDRESGRPIGTRLTSAGLTNQPFLDGMAPLAATDRDDEDDNNEPGPAGSGAPADAGKAGNMDLEKEYEELSAKHSALRAKWTEAVRERDDLTVKLTEKDAQIAKLQEQITLRDEAELKAYVSDTIATYGDRLPSKDEAVLMTLCKGNAAAFKAAFPRVAPAHQHLMRDLTSKGGKEPPMQERVSGEMPTMKALTDKYVAQGLDISKATNLAFKEHAAIRAGRAA